MHRYKKKSALLSVIISCGVYALLSVMPCTWQPAYADEIQEIEETDTPEDKPKEEEKTETDSEESSSEDNEITEKDDTEEESTESTEETPGYDNPIGKMSGMLYADNDHIMQNEGAPEPITYFISVTADEHKPRLFLDGEEIAEMRDDGKAPDENVGDLLYTAIYQPDNITTPPGYHAVTVRTENGLESDPYPLYVFEEKTQEDLEAFQNVKNDLQQVKEEFLAEQNGQLDERNIERLKEKLLDKVGEYIKDEQNVLGHGESEILYAELKPYDDGRLSIYFLMQGGLGYEMFITGEAAVTQEDSQVADNPLAEKRWDITNTGLTQKEMQILIEDNTRVEVFYPTGMTPLIKFIRPSGEELTVGEDVQDETVFFKSKRGIPVKGKYSSDVRYDVIYIADVADKGEWYIQVKVPSKEMEMLAVLTTVVPQDWRNRVVESTEEMLDFMTWIDTTEDLHYINDMANGEIIGAEKTAREITSSEKHEPEKDPYLILKIIVVVAVLAAIITIIILFLTKNKREEAALKRKHMVADMATEKLREKERKRNEALDELADGGMDYSDDDFENGNQVPEWGSAGNMETADELNEMPAPDTEAPVPSDTENAGAETKTLPSSNSPAFIQSMEDFMEDGDYSDDAYEEAGSAYAENTVPVENAEINEQTPSATEEALPAEDPDDEIPEWLKNDVTEEKKEKTGDVPPWMKEDTGDEIPSWLTDTTETKPQTFKSWI